MFDLWKKNLTQAELKEYETLRVALYTHECNVREKHYGHVEFESNDNFYKGFFSVLLTINYPDAERFYELCKKAYGEDVVVNSMILKWGIDELSLREAEGTDPDEMIIRKKA